MTEPLALEQKLLEALQPWDVAVTKSEAAPQALPKFPLGETWSATDWIGRPSKYGLTVKDPRGGDATGSHDVVLEGGEHLRLKFDGSRLLHEDVDAMFKTLASV